MQTWNIYTCNHCSRQVIAEEREIHECKPLKKHKIIANILWVSDGKTWYPLKLINRDLTRRKSTDDYTEPQITKDIK